MDCSMPGFPVFHHLLEFAQTHVHWVSNAIQPSHPLSPLSLPALNLSQHQGLFPMSQFFISGGHIIGASSLVLLMNTLCWFPLGLTGLMFLQSKGLSGVFCSPNIWKHQFLSAQPSLRFNCHILTWLLKKIIALIILTFVSRVMSLVFKKLSRFIIFSSKEQISFNFVYSHSLKKFWSPRK